jgi:hypothetical protein
MALGYAWGVKTNGFIDEARPLSGLAVLHTRRPGDWKSVPILNTRVKWLLSFGNGRYGVVTRKRAVRDSNGIVLMTGKQRRPGIRSVQ